MRAGAWPDADPVGCHLEQAPLVSKRLTQSPPPAARPLNSRPPMNADSNPTMGAASVRIERLPISTAPRDGSIVKMQQRNFSPFHARWVHGAWQPIEYRHGLPATHWLKEIADG